VVHCVHCSRFRWWRRACRNTLPTAVACSSNHQTRVVFACFFLRLWFVLRLCVLFSVSYISHFRAETSTGTIQLPAHVRMAPPNLLSFLKELSSGLSNVEIISDNALPCRWCGFHLPRNRYQSRIVSTVVVDELILKRCRDSRHPSPVQPRRSQLLEAGLLLLPQDSFSGLIAIVG
jgi:hypothetical protein